jgi:tripartite-type tricarboxylate transporter receptor subunit TctC
MTFSRREFLQLASGAAALPALAPMASAQAYPTRPVRIVVGLAPGGANDILARLIGQWLSERLSQPFVIENRPGGGGNIATESVVKSPPDGYTLLLAAGANAINATLYDKLNFNFIRDIAPVGSIVRLPNLVIVNPELPAKTIPELIAYARANSGKINIASPGTGTASHMAGELFNMMAGLNMVQVQYRGGAPATTDVIAGRAQIMFIGPVASIAHIMAGKLRALAVTTTARWERFPDLPTVGEFIPGYEASNWFGIGAPKGTPPEIIGTLNKEINAALADPKIKARLAELGGATLADSPADFGKLIAHETEKWGKVVRFASIRPD